MRDFDPFSLDNDEKEESKLLEKFYDYAKMEKNIRENQFIEQEESPRKFGKWGTRFIISSIIQGFVLVGFTAFLFLAQGLNPNVDFFEFISVLNDGHANFFYFGYLMYIALVVGIAITGIFYNHLEMSMNRSISNLENNFVWIHLFSLNVAGTGAILTLIIASLYGSGIFDLIFGTSPNFTVFSMAPFIDASIFLTMFLLCGLALGAYTYFKNFLK